MSGCQELERMNNGESLLISKGLLCRVMKMFWNQIVVMATQHCELLKTTELYTLNELYLTWIISGFFLCRNIILAQILRTARSLSLVPIVTVVVVQLLSCIWLFVTSWTAECQATLSFTISQSLLKLLFIVSSHTAISSSVGPFSSCPQSFPASGSFPMSWLFRWPKYWRLSFSISPSNEYSGLISFRTDWFNLLAVQGTLKSLLQHHNSKASLLYHSAFFMVQLSHLYMTIGKTIALTI